jgi:hypothetical protein
MEYDSVQSGRYLLKFQRNLLPLSSVEEGKEAVCSITFFVGFLFDFLFDPEDGGSTFLRKSENLYQLQYQYNYRPSTRCHIIKTVLFIVTAVRT